MSVRDLRCTRQESYGEDMPELPEVETVRNGMRPAMERKVILRAEVRRPDLRWPFPENMAARLTGKMVLALRRRSKYILMDLESGETLIIHLDVLCIIKIYSIVRMEYSWKVVEIEISRYSCLPDRHYDINTQ